MASVTRRIRRGLFDDAVKQAQLHCKYVYTPRKRLPTPAPPVPPT